MATLDLNGLVPGKTYNVMVRAKDSLGIYSGYSQIYKFTVPGKTSSGGQLTSKNSYVVTALAPDSASVVGGALVAGALDTNGIFNSGSINFGKVWNATLNTASGYPGLTGSIGGAVMINSTGILGYQFTSNNTSGSSTGQANFFLDTASGNAYFKGTIYATGGQFTGSVQIGSWSFGKFGLDIGKFHSYYSPISGIYQNDTSYWLDNGFFSLGNPAGSAGVNIFMTLQNDLTLYNATPLNVPSSLTMFGENSGAINLNAYKWNAGAFYYDQAITSDMYAKTTVFPALAGTYLGTTYLYQSASDTWTAGPKLVASNLPNATSTGVYATPTTSIPNSSYVDATIVFPTGRFSTAPIVTATWATGNTTPFNQNVQISIPATLVTSTGCTVRFHNYSGGAFSFPANTYYSIHAIQMTASAYSYGTMQ